MMFSRVSRKIVLLILVTGLLPLALFGAYAIGRAYETSRRTVVASHAALAEQVVGRVDQYVENNVALLEAIAGYIPGSGLDEDRKIGVLRRSVLDFEQYDYLRVLNLSGDVVMTSELAVPGINFAANEEFREAAVGRVAPSGVFMTDDLIPAIDVFVPMTRLNRVESVMMARLDLLHLWKLVEGLHVGKSGFLSLITPDGKLFATGDGSGKTQAIRLAPYDGFEGIVSHVGTSFEIARARGRDLVYALKTAGPNSWFLTVEEPLAEALALPIAMAWNLVLTVAIAVTFAVGAGWFVARRQIVRPVGQLMTRIHEIAAGNLHGRSAVEGGGEFVQLAATLDKMAGELTRIQQELVRQEKQALLGRIASSIAHDLKHPVMSVENYTRLLEKKHSDPEYRKLFLDTVSREFARIHAFLSDLKDLSKEISFHPVKTSVAGLIEGVLTSVKPRCDARNVSCDARLFPDFDAYLDVFSFQRVLNNLVFNAIEAMEDRGGKLKVSLKPSDPSDGDIGSRRVRIRVEDSGCGIEETRLATLFDDLRTTKKNGLGLGLAIAQKIVRQHGGTIGIESRLGVGTAFTIELPAA